jgi:hypothetical protein
MPQYVYDNTDDEITHFMFLNAYLEARGGEPVDLEPFRTLPSSKATGTQQMPRLTNLMQLTLDTSWWTRYRSRTANPDLGRRSSGGSRPVRRQYPAIPRSDADLKPDKHLQAIANTSGLHFATIEQGGTSLYASLAQSQRSDVLRVSLSIGPAEMMHFQTWSEVWLGHDEASRGALVRRALRANGGTASTGAHMTRQESVPCVTSQRHSRRWDPRPGIYDRDPWCGGGAGASSSARRR